MKSLRTVFVFLFCFLASTLYASQGSAICKADPQTEVSSDKETNHVFSDHHQLLDDDKIAGETDDNEEGFTGRPQIRSKRIGKKNLSHLSNLKEPNPNRLYRPPRS